MLTTEKTIRKINEVLCLHGEKQVADFDKDYISNTFAQCFYPHLYKRNPTKAFTKTNLDIEICLRLGYIAINEDAETVEEMIELTHAGSERIESKSDKKKELFVRLFYTVCGCFGTIAIAVIIELIKSLL